MPVGTPGGAPPRRASCWPAWRCRSVLGAGAMVLAEMLDTSFHSVDELRAFTHRAGPRRDPADRRPRPTRAGVDRRFRARRRRSPSPGWCVIGGPSYLVGARQRAARPAAFTAGQGLALARWPSTSSFYGLEREPFGPTPDPDFLFMTPGHREALAQLIYAIQEQKGFILLTGEVGMGKTTLLAGPAPASSTAATRPWPTSPTRCCPSTGILEYMLEEFEIAKPGESHGPAAGRAAELPHRAPPAPARTRCSSSTRRRTCIRRRSSRSGCCRTSRPPRRRSSRSCSSGSRSCRAKLELPELRQLKQRIGDAVHDPAR